MHCYIVDFVLFSQEKRRQQQERRSKNSYNHTMSRGGYKKLTEKLEKERLARLQEAAQSDPSVLSEPLPPIKRHTKWSEGRKHKDGSYVNNEAETVSHRIVRNMLGRLFILLRD